jgi:hypothetical protein
MPAIFATNASCPGANSLISTDESMAALSSARTTSSAVDALQTFIDQYRLKVVATPWIGDTDKYWDALDDADLPTLIAFGKVLMCEYARYSQGYITRSRITKVASTKHLRLAPNGKTCVVVGLASYGDGIAYHSIECIDFYGTLGQRRNVHHEFWHLMDAYPSNEDPAWVAFNDPAFDYGQVPIDPITGWGDRSTAARHPFPGFVSLYATRNEREDRAETYASLLVPEAYREMSTWLATDPILKNKVEYLKQIVIRRDPAMKDYFERK